MMKKSKVLIAQKAHPDVLALLSPYAELVRIKEGDADDFREKIADCQAVLLGTWIRFTAELMDDAKELKVISRTGAGVDNVDVDAATARGIRVLNTPGVNASSVAEHALSLMLALAKYIVFLDGQERGGAYGARRLNLPTDLDGKTLGLLGFGAIGRLLADKCSAAFHMDVLAYDPFVTDWPEGVRAAGTAEEVFQNADFVSLHMPLTGQTKHIVNEKTLAMMKPTAFLINTARGGLVDEDALYECLREQKIAGAGLDVLNAEPPSADNPLLGLDNVILTPHTAALTRECSLKVALCAAQGIADYLQGMEPAYVYNRAGLAGAKEAGTC